MGKLKRCVLLLQCDVKEDHYNLDGTQQAKKTHDHNGYGVDGCVYGIIIGVVSACHGLNGQD